MYGGKRGATLCTVRADGIDRPHHVHTGVGEENFFHAREPRGRIGNAGAVFPGNEHMHRRAELCVYQDLSGATHY